MAINDNTYGGALCSNQGDDWVVSGPIDQPFVDATTEELEVDWDQVTVVE